MLNVYFNYPNSAITIHGSGSCANIRQQRKVSQRTMQIDRTTLSGDLQRIKAREFKFASTSSLNDLWVKIDLSDTDLELAVVKHIHRQLAKNYKRFADALAKQHC